MSTRVLVARILLTVGVALLAGGLLLGFLPRTAAGVKCGSAFHGSDAATVADYGSTLAGSLDVPPAGGYAAACDTARSGARTPAVVLFVLGATCVAGGLVAAASRDQDGPAGTGN